MAAAPLFASHERLCIMNAMSPLEAGASTPAGENRGSLISRGFLSPSHGTEKGGLDTISSKGWSSQCCGEISVSSRTMLNLSKSILCRNILMRQRL